MTARQHRLIWLAKKNLVKKYPGFYRVLDDSIVDYEEGEEPSVVGTGSAFDILCAMHYGKRFLIEKLLKEESLNKNTLIDWFKHPKPCFIIKECS